MPGLAAPVMREIVGIRHQFDGPFVTDSSDTTATFGLEPTPWADVVAATTGVVRAAG